MTIRILIVLLFFLCQSTNNKTLDNNLWTNRLQDDIVSVFKGQKSIIQFQEVEYTNRYKELEQKFKTAVQSNQDWFLDYQKKIKPGEKMPYHKNLGLTKNEYEEFLLLMNNLRFITKLEKAIDVNIKDSIVTFIAPSEIELLNSLSFNLKDSTATLLNQKLKFDKEIKVKDSTNAWKQSWSGYKWSFTNPENYRLGDFSSVKDLSNFSAKSYKIFIGRLDKSKEYLMNIYAQEITNGAKTMNLDIYIKIKGDK